jgi:hypothetical protein
MFRFSICYLNHIPASHRESCEFLKHSTLRKCCPNLIVATIHSAGRTIAGITNSFNLSRLFDTFFSSFTDRSIDRDCKYFPTATNANFQSRSFTIVSRMSSTMKFHQSLNINLESQLFILITECDINSTRQP